MNIEGCTAIISGGGSGMGYGAAKLLAEKGAKVVLLGRREALVQDKAKALGGLGLACDIADRESVKAALDKAEAHFGTAQILVHAAAVGKMTELLQEDGSASPIEEIEQIVQINVMGTLNINQAFAERLVRLPENSEQPRGVIINVSSIGAEDGVPGSTYAMSKGAVNALGLSLARELCRWGIRVVTIAPGGIDTEMFRRGADAATAEAIVMTVPYPPRIGRPEEFAQLALQICENDYLNGCMIRLDGGMRIPFIRQ